MANCPVTWAKNKETHTGTTHMRYDSKHRTAAQIASDNIAEAETRLGTIHTMAEKRRKRVEQTAVYEADLQKWVNERQAHVACPGLELTPLAALAARNKTNYDNAE
jgi:hypothetical protein